jgi:hypothetical protein
MKDFKQTTKMKAEGSHYCSGGKVKKYAGGKSVQGGQSDGSFRTIAEDMGRPHNEVEKEIIRHKNYQNEPDYIGYEDTSTEGRAAIEAYDQNPGDAKKDYYKTKSMGMLSRSGVDKAQKAAKIVGEARKTNPMGDTFKRGGKVTKKKK